MGRAIQYSNVENVDVWPTFDGKKREFRRIIGTWHFKRIGDGISVIASFDNNKIYFSNPKNRVDYNLTSVSFLCSDGILRNFDKLKEASPNQIKTIWPNAKVNTQSKKITKDDKIEEEMESDYVSENT